MNKLFTKIAALALGATMAVGVGVAVASKVDSSSVHAGTEKVAYTLTPATTGKNGYETTDGEVEINGVTWNVEGNGTLDSDSAWRIGGKNTNCNPANRRVYSKNTISTQDITKVELTVGTASSITVNSLNLIVSEVAGGASSVTSTISGTFKASSTITFNRPNNVDWSSKYFTFKFNLSVSGSNNKFVQIKGAKFYYEESTSYTVSTSTSGLTLSTNSTTPSGGDITLTTAARKKGNNVQVSNTATSSVSGNVVSLSNVTGNVTINATIVDATPSLGVTGQKTRFTLEESWSFGGTVTKTYDDWVSPHTVDTVTAGNYTVDNSKFIAGTEGRYTITVSVTGCADFEYEVEVSNIQEKTDLINVTNMEASGTSYTTYTFNGSSSQTAYNSQNAVNSSVNLQYRSSNNNSGLVNTNTKGTVKSVKITAASGTPTVKIYAKNTAYSAPTDLYGDNAGTNVEDITTSTNATYTFEDDYSYIGLRSSSGAIYLSSIEITWLVTPKAVHHIGASEVTASGPFYVGTKPTLADLGVTVKAYYDQAETDFEDVTSFATITYPVSGLTDDNNGGDGYTISYGGKTTTVNITAEVADIYAKITSVTDLIVGSTIRIATSSYVMSTTNTGSSTQLDYVSGNAEVASLAETANLTVSADQYGYYFSYEDNSTTYYLYCNSSSDAVLGFTTTLGLNAHWNVSINNSGVATISNADNTTRYLKSNGSTHRFACFASGQDNVSIYQLVDNDMTPAQKVAAQIDTFGKLYLHKLDILINETTRASDGTTCNGYYDKAKAALTGDWSPIQEDFSKDSTGMWERYCSWAWVTYHEVPTFSGGVIVYNRAGETSIFAENESSSAITIVVIVSVISLTAIGGYIFLRRRKEQ